MNIDDLVVGRLYANKRDKVVYRTNVELNHLTTEQGILLSDEPFMFLGRPGHLDKRYVEMLQILSEDFMGYIFFLSAMSLSMKFEDLFEVGKFYELRNMRVGRIGNKYEYFEVGTVLMLVQKLQQIDDNSLSYMMLEFLTDNRLVSFPHFKDNANDFVKVTE